MTFLLVPSEMCPLGTELKCVLCFFLWNGAEQTFKGCNSTSEEKKKRVMFTHDSVFTHSKFMNEPFDYNLVKSVAENSQETVNG